VWCSLIPRRLIPLAVAGIMLATGLDAALAQTPAKPGAPPPATPLTPTSLAIPRPLATPQTGMPETSTSQAGTPEASTSQAGTPPLAITPPDTSESDASRTARPRPAPHRSLSPAAAAAKGILLVTTQHPSWGRISFVLRGNPAPEVLSVPGGVEVHLASGVHLEMSRSAQLRETGPINMRDDGAAAVALIHLNCRCTPEQGTESGILRLDIHSEASAALQSGTQPNTTAKDGPEKAGAPNAATVAQQETARPGTDVRTPAGANPQSLAKPGTEAKPDSVAKTQSGAPSGTEANSGMAAATTAKAAVPARPSEAEEMARLRAFLTDKLAKLNATPPQVTASEPQAWQSDAAASRPSPATRKQTQASGPAAGDAVAQDQPEASTGPCLPPVDASGWRGAGSFSERLVALRTQTARSRSAADDVAALAEFYLANGLGHEAVAAATDALAFDTSPEARLRLSRDADIGRLSKGEKLSADSPLLSNPANCQRTDASLWRDLGAAAEGDAEGAARDPEVAAAALRVLPGPLQRALAFRIVAAVGDNLDALRAMAGAMRNATAELPEDEAGRFLLQARIAGLTGDHAEYAVFLERAARFDTTAPGVMAKALLAAIRASAGGPGAAHAEAVLIDIARTYRHDSVGQEAAEQYAELRLRRHDYATALAMADESAGPRGPHPRQSRGADLVLRILRLLFIDPATAALPEPTERIALFLRYGGYTTPGEKGDDVRVAAARLMLAHHLPDAALDTLRQLSETTAATPEASQMLATAEAYGGDPAKALDLVKALPDDIAAHRIAAEALRRMRQPLQAAHALDGAVELADRERRASLLFEAEAWPDAVSAYADLLRDPLLPATARNDLATRYALAVAMNGPATNVTAMKLPDAPGRLLAAVPPVASDANGTPPSLRALRSALERARRIETLLDPPTVHQGS
jgi:hypothetical protein